MGVGGSPLPAFGADSYVSGPLSTANIRMFKQARNGGWTLANELPRNSRYRLTFDSGNRSPYKERLGTPFYQEDVRLHHLRIRMNVNLCYRAFTDPAFRKTFLPHPSQHKWDITPVNQHVELDPGRSTQAHLYFIWNCDHENAMMMSSERVPRVVARAEFDASLDSGDVYQSKPHLYFNQKVQAQYSRTEMQPGVVSSNRRTKPRRPGSVSCSSSRICRSPQEPWVLTKRRPLSCQ
jgi:hypothetical protein